MLIAMGFSWIPLLCVIASLVLDHAVGSAADEGFLCPGNYNCSCAMEGQSGYDLTCPAIGEQKITVKLKLGQSAVLQCQLTTQSEDYKLLGDVKISRVDKLRFHLCPLPDAPLKEILQIQNAGDIKQLQVDSYRPFNNSLERKHFTGLSGIKYLLLVNNGLTALPHDLLMDMAKLDSLDLSNNRVQLPSDLLQPVLGLQVLDLGSNELTTLPPGLFRNLKKLHLLNLWKNKLSNLSPDLFKDLTNLTSLDLSNNGLTTLPADVFQHLVKLKNLSLNGNNFRALPAGLFRHTKHLELAELSDTRDAEMRLPGSFFANLTSLKIVNLYKSGLKELPEDLFWGSTGIDTISLENNKLKTLPQHIFRDQEGLRVLKLGYNQLSTFPDNMFSRLGKIQVLDTSFNKLTHISKDMFNGLEEIRELKLNNNSLQNIDLNAFLPMRMLRVVDLSRNQLSFHDGPSDTFGVYSPLKHCTGLEKIDLSYNLISDIYADWRVTMTSLRELNLNHNKLQALQFPDMAFTANVKVDVRHNNISVVSLGENGEAEAWAIAQPNKKDKNQEWFLEGNPLWCDCSNYELLRYFERLLAPELLQQITLNAGDLTCVGPQEVQNQRVSDVPSRAVTCSMQRLANDACMHPCICPEPCSCLFRPSDRAIVVDCIKRNLTAAPEMLPEVRYEYSDHTELYLTHNRLRSLPDFTLPGYKNVTKLFAGFNNISAVNLTSIPKALQVLELDHNNMSFIEPTAVEVLSNLTKLTSITLHNNPWTCDCAAQPLLNFIRAKRKVFGPEQVNCTNGQLLSELTASELCSLPGGVIWPLVAVILLLGLLASVLAALYYRYKREVKVWLFTHRMCLWFVTEEELDKDKIFDAFVSYSNKDKEFVEKELVPKLEGGPNPFKLCLHFRDWVAGEWIPNQIARSVEDSRRTLVVLSPNFLESVWGRMEFRAAHSQALSEGRARVIVVLYGDIGPTEDLDPELRAYLNMNTYVEWGDPWFYDKLRYALPHPPELVRGGIGMGLVNRNNRNTKAKPLDDKIELICEPNAQAPIISTPAAEETVDPLSKHQLNGTKPPPQKVPLPMCETNGTAAAVG